MAQPWQPWQPRQPRQARSFRESVLFQFRSQVNLRYLAGNFRRALALGDPRRAFVLDTLADAADAFGSTFGQGGELIDTANGPPSGGGPAAELHRLNQKFFELRLLAAERVAAGRRPVAAEPLFYQMFADDSLRLPGSNAASDPFLRDGPPSSALHRAPDHAAFEQNYDPAVGVEDMAWSAGRATRSAEEAIVEYYGAESPFGALGAATGLAGGRPGLPSVSGFENWFELSHHRRTHGPSVGRFERRGATAPWKHGGRRNELVFGRSQSADGAYGATGDVEETLGSGSAEFGGELLGQVRRRPQKTRAGVDALSRSGR